MPYTRRKLLRDSALASLVGAAGSPLTLLADSTRRPKREYWRTNSPTFNSGIRVFFIGGWFFTPDKQTPGNVLAITLDMANIPHTFPHGAWPDDDSFNANDSIGPNPSARQFTTESLSHHCAGFSEIFHHCRPALSGCGHELLLLLLHELR